MPGAPASRHLSRRSFLTLTGVGLVAAGTGGYAWWRTQAPTPIAATSPVVATRESARATTGVTVRRTLAAGPTVLDLAGRRVSTWAYDGAVPTAEIRANAGDRLSVRLTSSLPVDTSVHWHGVALRNDMDGVPGLTQDAVPGGGSFDYDFVLPDPGTYWFHPHVGVQLDTGLHGALVVEDPAEPLGYDIDHVVVLDDWTDGWGDSPEQILARMRSDGMVGGSMASMDGMDMGSMMSGTASSDAPLGTDAGDQSYPAHLVNGGVPEDPWVLSARPGTRVRLRFVNAASDTAYRVALTGHVLTVTHADGWAVDPVDVDALLIGQGERYDVVVTLGDGAFALVAAPEGKADPLGYALVRTSSGVAPEPGVRPSELTARLLGYDDLRPAAGTRLASADVDRNDSVALQMLDGGRAWAIDGRTWPDHRPVEVAPGQRLRLTVRNESMMYHPVHLHGHTFSLVGGAYDGVRKDTVLVLPMGEVTFDVAADNPGQWPLHCHNIYHAELGMMTVLRYVQ